MVAPQPHHSSRLEDFIWAEINPTFCWVWPGYYVEVSADAMEDIVEAALA